MKKLIGSDVGSYVFDPANDQISFLGLPPFSLANVLVITDVTAGVMLYNFADSTIGGSLTGSTLTLEYDCAALSGSDVLQIWVDLPEEANTEEIPLGERDLCCDPLDAVPQAVIPHLFGPQGVQQSFPVSIANEQFFDANISNVIPVGATWTGKNGLAPNGGWFDCSQYRSISFEAIAPAGTTVTLTFEGSNDGATAVAVSLFDSNALTTAPVTSVAIAASTNRFFEGPIKHRYFRARVSTAVAGSPVGTWTRLSLAPWVATVNQVANSAGNWSSNIAQIAGNTAVTGGVVGLLGVGGNVSIGAVPTANPVTVGGVDTTGKIRRYVSDIVGNHTVVGPDPALLINKTPVNVRIEEGSGSGYGVQDLLYLILQELKNLRLLPEYLNNGRNMSEDAEALAFDHKQQ